MAELDLVAEALATTGEAPAQAEQEEPKPKSKGKSAKEKEEPQAPAEPEEAAVDLLELVAITLPKNRHQVAPVYVAVGNYNAVIPRGKKVMVPRYVALHIEECELQDARAADMQAQLSAQYENDVRGIFG